MRSTEINAPTVSRIGTPHTSNYSMSDSAAFSDDEKALVVAFTDWLAAKKNFDSTSLEIVQQTLAEASGLDLHVPSSATIRPFSLLDVFNAGRTVLEKQRADFDAKVLPKLNESNFFATAAAGMNSKSKNKSSLVAPVSDS